MVAYSFQARFTAPIEADQKLQTVRAPRKRHARRGEDLQLYTGMRTRSCRLIGRRRCLTVHPILINIALDRILLAETCPLVSMKAPVEIHVWCGQTIPMQAADLDHFAVRDGFADWRDMKAFWRDAHPDFDNVEQLFAGVLIRWLPSDATATSAVAASQLTGLNAELNAIGVR